MRCIPNMKRTLIGCTTLMVCGTLGVAAIAQYGGEDGVAPPPPTDPPQRPGERAERPAQTHTGIVVDLTSYLEKEQQQRRRPTSPDHRRMQRESPPTTPPRPGRPGTPGERDRDDDAGIDWTDGEYRENLDEGVPMVLMIEEQARWRSAEHRPHVVTFDPNNDDSKEAFQQLKRAAGEEVEVTGEIRKQGAIRGLSVFKLKNVE